MSVSIEFLDWANEPITAPFTIDPDSIKTVDIHDAIMSLSIGEAENADIPAYIANQQVKMVYVDGTPAGTYSLEEYLGGGYPLQDIAQQLGEDITEYPYPYSQRGADNFVHLREVFFRDPQAGKKDTDINLNGAQGILMLNPGSEDTPLVIPLLVSRRTALSLLERDADDLMRSPRDKEYVSLNYNLRVENARRSIRLIVNNR
jgi:hypothetical protein